MKDDDFDMDGAFEIMSSNSFEDDNDSDFRNYGDDVSSLQNYIEIYTKEKSNGRSRIV